MLKAWQARDTAVVGLTRRDVDITSSGDLLAMLARLSPSVIVNCTAYNAVDQAEEAPLDALAINTFAVRTLARAAQAANALLVHYSTDFVFAGDRPAVLTEEMPPSPQSVYGMSKLLGEWLAEEATRHYVIRVESLFGGPNARSSVDRLIRTVRDGQETPVFHDRTVTPSFVEDVVQATSHLIDAGAPFGLYHAVNDGETTWLDIGRYVCHELAKPVDVLRPVSVSDLTFRARRPQYAALSGAKLARAGFEMPSWQDAIARYLRCRPDGR